MQNFTFRSPSAKLPKLTKSAAETIAIEVLTRIRRITHKSVGPEARFRYHFQ